MSELGLEPRVERLERLVVYLADLALDGGAPNDLDTLEGLLRLNQRAARKDKAYEGKGRRSRTITLPPDEGEPPQG